MLKSYTVMYWSPKNPGDESTWQQIKCLIATDELERLHNKDSLFIKIYVDDMEEKWIAADNINRIEELPRGVK